VPEDVFLEELEFYQLGDNIIQDYKEKEGFIMEKKMLLPKVIAKLLWNFVRNSVCYSVGFTKTF